MKMYVSAMAESKKEVERSMYFHTKIIVEHIIKAALMPEHSARNHWFQEIATQMKEVDKLKQTKAYPTKDQIYKWTYGKRKDLVTDAGWMSATIKDLQDEYGYAPNMSQTETMTYIDKICESYFTWLSSELSQKGKVPNSEIYRKLNSLM